MRKKTTLSVSLALLCTACVVVAQLSSAADLRPPVEASYGINGVTDTTLTAALSSVNVGNARYQSQVFNNSYDAPLLRTRPGGTLKVLFNNKMNDITNLHFHGMLVSPLDDGDNIFKLIQPHTQWQFNIKLPGDHPSGAFWYHSHFNRGSNRQVAGGLAGPILVDGMLDPFPELQGITERVMVLRNFQKTLTHKQARQITTGAPSIRTINGQYQPEIPIRPGETQLWHFYNVASNQYFHIDIDGLPFQVLSRDGNTATKKDMQKRLLIGPSARFSILFVGPPIATYKINLYPATTGPPGDKYSGQVLGYVNSKGEQQVTRKLTSPYSMAVDYRKVKVNESRVFTFQDSQYDPLLFFINGKRWDIGRVNTTVKLGDVEEWRLLNPSQELHQFHIHQTDFQVVSINGRPVDFTGYRDNVYIPATGTITVRIPFTDPLMLGKFVYHCHILEHEDGGMMATIQVVKPEDYEKAVKLEPLGGIYGNNQMCAYLQNTNNENLYEGLDVRYPAAEDVVPEER